MINETITFSNLTTNAIIFMRAGSKSLDFYGSSFIFHGWTISYTEIVMLITIFGLIGWCIYLTYKLKTKNEVKDVK